MRLVCPSRYRPTFPCGVWLVAFAELTFHVTTVGLIGLDPQAAAQFVTPLCGAGRELEIIGSHGMAASDFPAILKMVRRYWNPPGKST